MRISLGFMQVLQQTCPDLPVTLDEDFREYTILVEKATGEDPAGIRYRVAAFNLMKDMIYNDSGPSLEKAIAGACATIRASQKSSERAR